MIGFRDFGLETEAIEGVRHRPRSSRTVMVCLFDNNRCRLVYRWKMYDIASTGEYKNLRRWKVQGNTRKEQWSLVE